MTQRSFNLFFLGLFDFIFIFFLLFFIFAEILSKFTAPDNKVLQDEILDKVSEYCPNAVTHPSKDEYVPPYIWSFYHSFFFSFIVCSTVGK